MDVPAVNEPATTPVDDAAGDPNDHCWWYPNDPECQDT